MGVKFSTGNEIWLPTKFFSRQFQKEDAIKLSPLLNTKSEPPQIQENLSILEVNLAKKNPPLFIPPSSQ
jgi:hypothetical protein